MSITTTVFIKDERVPSPAAWAERIRSHGFKMELDSDFDPREHSGFLPCTYGGEPAGFEYFFEQVSEMELEEVTQRNFGDRDVAISFVTHSDFRELMAAVIAASILSDICDGVLWDTEADELVASSDGVAWARKMEASLKNEL